MSTPYGRLVHGVAAVGLAAVLVVVLAGCTDDGSPSAEPRPQPPLTAGTPAESEVPAGWDEASDGPPPTPDADLSDDDLRALLRTRSSAADAPDACAPEGVDLRLAGFDMALGHRYTSLVVTNTSAVECTIEGVPGMGARGEWGHRFTLTVEPGSTVSGKSGEVVRLAPGAEARSLVEWTGELAGSESEKASLLVVQLASGQVPVRVAPLISDLPEDEASLDIGMFTTLRPGPFEQ